MSAASVHPVLNTPLQLVLAAERLVAEFGPDGVSLRQIAVEAGSSNNSAIQYHFGSKGGLLEAVVTYRLDDLTHRRAMLRERADPTNVRACLEAHVLPLIEMAERPGSHYLAFVEQLQRSRSRVLLEQPAVRAFQSQFQNDMAPVLRHLPQSARQIRITQALDMGLHASAERERSVNRDEKRASFSLFASALIDGLVGYLSAPPSPETKRLIKEIPQGRRPTASKASTSGRKLLR